MAALTNAHSSRPSTPPPAVPSLDLAAAQNKALDDAATVPPAAAAAAAPDSPDSVGSLPTSEAASDPGVQETDFKEADPVASLPPSLFDFFKKEGYTDLELVEIDHAFVYKAKKIDPEKGDCHTRKIKIFSRDLLKQAQSASLNDLFGPNPETRGELLVKERVGDHPQIVTLLERFFLGETSEWLVEIYPFIEGDDMHKYLDALSEDESAEPSDEEVIDWAIQIASLVVYLHNRGIVWRDLKPENIILSSDRKTIYIIDFSTAKKSASRTQLSPKGAPDYRAPEPKMGWFPKTDEELFKLDSFSFGSTLHYLYATRRPYKDIQAYYNRRAKPDIDPTLPVGDLVRSLISLDSSTRPTMVQALETLEKQKQALSEDPS